MYTTTTTTTTATSSKLLAYPLRFTSNFSPSLSSIIESPISNHHRHAARSLTQRLQTLSHKLSYHLRTLYLFIRSDLRTLLLPFLLFGLVAVLSPSITTTTTTTTSTLFLLPRAAAYITAWFILNLLPFTIANQRLPAAIDEDAINKPWRPLPSNRLTPQQAERLMVLGYIVAALASATVLGGLYSSIAFAGLAYCYNTLGGADRSGFVRNLMNVSFYVCVMVGTVEVATVAMATAGGQGVDSVGGFSAKAWMWIAMIGGVVLTTAHVQDLPDQEGDSARGRRTVPLEIGDVAARWTVAVLDLGWSLAAGLFWGKGALGFVAPVGLAGVVAVRLLRKRSVREDKVTLMIWNLWMISMYLLPLGQ